MSKYSFQIVRTHPLLDWLTSRPGPRTVPRQVSDKLASLGNISRTQRLLQTCGLPVVKYKKRCGDIGFAIRLAQPEDHREYYGPQLVLPRLHTEEAPFGTALMNCLLPQTKTEGESQKIFAQFQAALERFADILEALPFACITGHKTRQPGHELDRRGFRFFFSPRPDILFNRIHEILITTSEVFQDRCRSQADRARRSDLMLEKAAKLTRLKCALTSEGPVGHPLLDNITPMDLATVLVDMREK